MVRGFIEDLASGVAVPLDGQSYSLLQADTSHDIWALGALLYCFLPPNSLLLLCHVSSSVHMLFRFHVATGCTLWHCDRDENLVDEVDFLKLGEWKDEVSTDF